MKLDTVVCGDCLDILPTIPGQSVDAVITDPPYPHIKRDYGYWTTEEWWELIVEGVIPEVKRILKPTGSAVFVLQPNSEKVGKMRGWLWEFMAWVCREWNMVQDVWWWNQQTMPSGGATNYGTLRPSIKACVWCGSSSCYRNQNAVLWKESDSNRIRRITDRIYNAPGERRVGPSGRGAHILKIRQKAEKRNGVTPFNLLPFGPDGFRKTAGRKKHGGVTPLQLTDWWVRYIVPKGGLVVDPFIGTGTTAVAAIQNRCHFFGCDTVQDYVGIANERAEKARLEVSQMEMNL